jgi:hypothetical protein
MGQGQGKLQMPGVVYSEDWTPPDPSVFAGWRGAMYHMKLDKLPKGLAEHVDVERAVNKPGPEAEPYTFWERIGAVPISMARVRPRQYYHPVTNFATFDYDEQSPEEVELRARWLARMFDYGWTYPATMFCIGSAASIPLPFRIRLPMMAAVGITVVFAEFQRVYANAAKEKEMLDDFLMAKEIWYIKNVETKEFGLDTLPVGMTGLEAIHKRQEEEAVWEDIQNTMVRDGMVAKASQERRDRAAGMQPIMGQSLPGFRGPGLEGPDGKPVQEGYYAGEVGVKRPGQVIQPRWSLLGVKTDKRIPDVPI